MTLSKEKQKYHDNNELCGALLWFFLLSWLDFLLLFLLLDR